jgi:hypothetical protein
MTAAFEFRFSLSPYSASGKGPVLQLLAMAFSSASLQERPEPLSAMDQERGGHIVGTVAPLLGTAENENLPNIFQR